MTKFIETLPSNRNFGLVFFVFFLILFYFFENKLLILFSVIFLILGLLNSKILTPINKIWTKFGLILGYIISPIIMTIIYFFTVFPINIIMKCLGKDILHLKMKKEFKSYWIIEETKKLEEMKYQF